MAQEAKVPTARPDTLSFMTEGQNRLLQVNCPLTYKHMQWHKGMYTHRINNYIGVIKENK